MKSLDCYQGYSAWKQQHYEPQVKILNNLFQGQDINQLLLIERVNLLLKTLNSVPELE